MEKKFPFMIITDHMQESLIILRRHFCWKMDDLYFLDFYVKKYKEKLLPYDKRLVEKARSCSPLDWKLYKHYNETLWKHIAEEGNSFWDELSFFTFQNEKIGSFCKPLLQKIVSRNFTNLQELLNKVEILKIPGSQWGDEVKIDFQWCVVSKLQLPFFKKFYLTQNFPQLCKTDNVYIEKKVYCLAYKGHPSNFNITPPVLKAAKRSYVNNLFSVEK